MSQKPLILVTNDDGISAKGIHSLALTMMEFGEVVMIAPDKPQSGMGHAITINHPLRLSKSNIHPEIEAYACTGTPVDCVKLGIYEILKKKPDLIVSGINHGANTATNVLYSGTMSAAVEGAMEGIPSIGFSYYDYNANADFNLAIEVVRKVTAEVLKTGMDKGICLNVNVPKIDKSNFKGIKVCRQAHAFWEDRFDKREDQFGRPYYWLTGDFAQVDQDTDSDLFAIEQGFASVVPTQFDLTAYSSIEKLKNLEHES